MSGRVLGLHPQVGAAFSAAVASDAPGIELTAAVGSAFSFC